MTQEEVNVLALFILLGIVWSVVKSAMENFVSKYTNQGRAIPHPVGLANQQIEDLHIDDGRSRSYAGNGFSADVARDLEMISRIDPRFDVRTFLDSGRLVYEAVIMAFAKGDRDLLRELTSDEVYDAFSAAIEQRERRSEQAELNFICFDEVKVSNIALFNNHVQITIGFVAQLVMATRRKNGAIVQGDPNKVQSVGELWTFGCEFASQKPAWKLVATDTM